MTSHSTEPSGDAPGLPLRSLVATVLEGASAGATATAQSETLTIGSADGNDLVLDDRAVSRFHLELERASGGVRVLDPGSTNGTYYEGARIERAVLRTGSILTLGRSKIRVDDGERLTVALHEHDEYAGLVGRTPAMRRLMARIALAARSDSAVLLVGESGTGKELIARALHAEGPRSKGPFVTVDCGSLAPSLVASELFGHQKGAFTGAIDNHVGAFERANGGTLFLDEIGELAPALQPSLLGALERKRFRRVGGRADIEVDVRVVSATHRDLRAEVNAGTFRLDLYYRLAVVVLRVPALRERLEDIPLLVERFMREAGDDASLAARFPDTTLAALAQHRFPGNVRELRNLVEATLAMGELEAGALDVSPSSPSAPIVGEAALALPYREARAQLLEEFEGRYLAALIERAAGNVSLAARNARMDRTYLIKLLAKHGLK